MKVIKLFTLEESNLSNRQLKFLSCYFSNGVPTSKILLSKKGNNVDDGPPFRRYSPLFFDVNIFDVVTPYLIFDIFSRSEKVSNFVVRIESNKHLSFQSNNNNLLI